MPFTLGSKSQQQLGGVHPSLVLVVKRAIQLTAQDFGVHDGLRTKDEQARLVAAGASKTMNSMHLPQVDGFGHAVDLVPYINGQLRWEAVPCCAIAAAVQRAALELDVELIWGSAWDRKLNGLASSPEGLMAAAHEYSARHPGPDFLDWVHYQLA